LKKFLILIIVIIFSSLTFADDNFRVAPLQTILQSANLVDSEDIRTKLTLDFFKYYKLETQYDTPLKKKMYMQSKEYQDKLAEFNGLKKEVASKRYYLSCGSVGEYDLKKKGFWFCIDYNEIYYRSDQTLSEGITFYFTSLPTVLKDPDPNPLANPNQGLCLLLQMPEKKALEVENKKATIYLLFNISKYMKRNFTRKWDNYTWDHDVISTKNVRVIVANDSTGEIFFDKTYM